MQNHHLHTRHKYVVRLKRRPHKLDIATRFKHWRFRVAQTRFMRRLVIVLRAATFIFMAVLIFQFLAVLVELVDLILAWLFSYALPFLIISAFLLIVLGWMRRR